MNAPPLGSLRKAITDLDMIGRNQKTYKIDDICTLVKGSFPTLRTEPGDFPLVVTAEFRRSANAWDIEGPAVCVPLISSSGHGDASLNRVHYQEGQFALANLLVALVPKKNAPVVAKYLYYVLSTRKDSLLVPLMLGTANVSLKVKDIASVEITLPSIDEQQRIVARIGTVQRQLQKVNKLRDSVMDELRALCRSLIVNDLGTKKMLVAELVKQRPPDVSVEPDVSYQFAGVYSFGRGVFKGGLKTGAEFAYPKLSRIKSDDFIYPKLMAWEGALGVVPDECDGCVVSPEFPVFEIDKTKVLPAVFDVYFRDPNTWESLQGGSTGTNARRRRLNPADFLKLKIPVPSMATQQKLSAIRLHQKQIQGIDAGEESSAVMTSVLNKMLA